MLVEMGHENFLFGLKEASRCEVRMWATSNIAIFFTLNTILISFLPSVGRS
jgi:hypothetical protein